QRIDPEKDNSIVKFHTVNFTYWEKQEGHAGIPRRVSIQVSEPVSVKYKDNIYYVPVTPKETFEIAKKFAAIPLTRAISDRAFNPDNFFERPKMSATNQDAFNLEKLADEMKDKYATVRHQKLVSGAHKIWMI